MPRVLVDATLIEGPGSGTATRMRHLLDAYADLFGPQDVALVVDRRRPPSELTRHAFEVIEVEAPIEPSQRVREATAFWARLLNRLGVSVVQTEGLPPPVLQSSQGMVLATVHDLRFLHRRCATLPRRLGGRFVVLPRLKRAHRVLTVSEAMAEELEQAGIPRTRIAVVANGVAFPEQEMARPRTQTLLVVGHLEKRKNPQTAIRGFAEWKERPGPMELVLVGEDRDNLEPSLTRLSARLGVGDRVTVTGKVSDEELAKRLLEAQAVVLPSLYEGFGLVGLEAQVVGTPVIASDLPAHREVLGDSATFFKAGDASSLAQALTRFRAMGDADKNRGFDNARRWTWTNAAQSLRAVHEEAWAQ